MEDKDLRDLLRKETNGSYLNPNNDYRIKYLNRDDCESWESLFITSFETNH